MAIFEEEHNLTKDTNVWLVFNELENSTC